MQPHDQDELRKQAQRALTRRIATEPDRRVEAPPEPERPRDRQQRPEPDPSPMRESTASELAGPRTPESVSPPLRYEQEPTTLTERRRPSPSPSPQVARSAYDITPPRRSEIYGMLHSRASLRQALIVNEILGRPKALRESSDPENFGGI